MTTGIEVRVYDGNDPTELLAVLDRTRDRQWTDPLSDVGSGSFLISPSNPKLADASVLEYGNIVRLSLAGTERFAFLIEQKTIALVSDAEDAGRWIKVTGRSVLALLETAVVYPAGGLGGSPERLWGVTTAGKIMGDLVFEAQERGALPDVNDTFTNTHGSDGVILEVALDLSERAGSDLLRVALRHAELAVDVEMTPALELRYVNARGVDRTTGAAPVVLRPGQGLTGLGLEGVGRIRNTLLIETAAGYADRQDAGSATAYGRREAFLALGNVESADQRNQAADSVLAAQAAPADAIRVMLLEGEGPQPYVDFDLGDTILAPDAAGQLVPQRLKGLTVQEDDQGVITYTPELSARHVELELRLARWLKTISEGTVGGRAAAVSSPTADAGTVSAIEAAVDAHEVAFPHPDELADLADVDVTGVDDQDVLTFDAASGQWVPASPAAAAGLLPCEAVVAAGPLVWANMPAAETELGGQTYWRTLVDATDATQVRLIVSVGAAGAGGSVLRGQYSSDEGASWHDLGAGDEPDVGISDVGVKSSAWVALAAGATEPIFVRVVGEGGDAATDPLVVNVALQFR